MPNADLLAERLAGIDDVQKRARIAIWIAALVCCAILALLWNAYLSWDRQWSGIYKLQPEGWGKQILVEQRIRAWQQTYDVNVALLGIHLAAGDAAFLGSLALLALSYYVFLTVRDVNREVGTLLLEQANAESAEKKRIHTRIGAGMLLNGPRVMRPIRSTSQKLEYDDIAESRTFPFDLLLSLPLVTVVLIIGSDLYFAFSGYASPFRGNRGPAFSGLDPTYKTTLIVGDLIAAACAIGIWRILRSVTTYHGATTAIVREFAASA